jgi:hypothetical protein
MSLAEARSVADAVLYEGYLLYPYRATSAKNQLRWQFGVLGPEHAAEDGLGEDSRLATQCLLRAPAGTDPEVTVHLRFLQLQLRTVEQAADDEQPRGARRVSPRGLTQLGVWEEAVEQEVILPRMCLSDLPTTHRVTVPGGQDTEPLDRTADGHPARRQFPGGHPPRPPGS